MASSPMSDPQQQGGAGASGPPAAASAPSQAPASPEQMALAQMFQMCKRLSESNPVLSGGLQKAAAGIQEAQTAMVTQPQQQPATQNPAY